MDTPQIKEEEGEEEEEELLERSSVEFTHHRAAANRNPPSIGHIFIFAVSFLRRTLSPLLHTSKNLLLAYWHEVIRLKTTAASSWPTQMSW